MSAEFLFSFLMFFQVQIDSIRQSGFYQLMEQKYPQISEGMKSIESEDEIQDFLKLTGLKFDNMQSFSFTLEGLDSMAKAQEVGRNPKIGSELDLLVQTRFTGKINHNELIGLMLKELEKEKGNEVRDRVEKTKRTNGNTTYMTIPTDVMGKEVSDADLLMAIKKEKNHTDLMVGVPAKVEHALKGTSDLSSLVCLESMAKNRQVTFAVKVDPALWNRPEFAANQQNPLFAGLANSVKGIRELGVSVSFLEDSLGMEICVNCKDTQSALGLWTVAQGGLGMAQLAMSQEGSQAPAILNRVKTQAVDKNVFVRVEVFPSDIDEFAGQLLSPASIANEERKNGPELMKGKKAPAIKTQLLDGQNLNFLITREKW